MTSDFFAVVIKLLAGDRHLDLARLELFGSCLNAPQDALDIDLHDVPDHEYAQSQTFKPCRYIKIDDISDMEAHKMTHFYRDELKRIYQCFGLED